MKNTNSTKLKDSIFLDKHASALMSGKDQKEIYRIILKDISKKYWSKFDKTFFPNYIDVELSQDPRGNVRIDWLVHINNIVSQYLGTGWTSEPIAKENLITSRNLLSMTSGIDDDPQLVIKLNLNYVSDAGTRWAYGNVFQKLMDIVAYASNQDFESYFNAKIKNKIGMDGFWNNGIIYKIYNSNTRSMARFGLLALNKGTWINEQIVNEPFFNESINTSQSINPSYGFLWWLNGKAKYMVPSSQTVYQGALVPNAPVDMYAAMGARDQRIYVIPSKNMVIIRMGGASDPLNSSFALSGFDNELWAKINELIK